MDIKTLIQHSLQKFADGNLKENATSLLATLGYHSEKTVDLDGNPQSFLNTFASNTALPFISAKALVDEWVEIHLLFQLTDDELSDQHSLFQENNIKQGLMNSYLFFALKLKGESYARGKISQITRQINRLFPMPVMVFFEYDEKLSIAVINRRMHKRDSDKDVLGKVTLIQEINYLNPHRGHLDILASFSIEELKRNSTISNFEHLHSAWEEIFNIELLNKKFYRELSNWYFWSSQQVHFPADNVKLDGKTKADNENKIKEHDAKNLIRLLTRLLFVWFVKEKGLIPEELFQKEYLSGKLLNSFNPESENSTYYKAILQNLFFATLNQTVGGRDFRNSGQHQNTTTLMRYEDLFQDPKNFISMLEAQVPFMNGGLFECLDAPHPTKKGPQGGAIILYEDGFSDRKDNPLLIPDLLFFGRERIVDLSDIYGDPKRKKEKVRGIIHILNNYKFTIVENTPIEQEIALDPELLGQVFENLLASYNPETKTTARKQTGSFYTPRTIVDYMVDESLKAHLQKELCSRVPEMKEEDAQVGLEILFAYTEKEHAFTEVERAALIAAIDECKILDPACGSGAFPMGVLHKLEFVLNKLDPRNELWRNRQIEKVDATIRVANDIDDERVREITIKELEAHREDIQEAFDHNDLGYGRKLYLIENCIYGVDIQPIAVQVSKLRFFISLIVDQEVDLAKQDFGVRPLPNLEIKFVSADSLISIETPEHQQQLFNPPQVKLLEKELKQVRHKMFSAKTPAKKAKYRTEDKSLREEIASELEDIGWSNPTAQQLAHWDPYDQNASADYFSPEWMFDVEGFDVVIGNPPWVQIQKFPQSRKTRWVDQKFETYAATADIYCLFYERGTQLLKPEGHLCYITSNKWMRAGYGAALRRHFTTRVSPIKFIDFGGVLIFNSATVDSCILLFQKVLAIKSVLACSLGTDYLALNDLKSYFEEKHISFIPKSTNEWVVLSSKRSEIKMKVEAQGVALQAWELKIFRGVLTGLNQAFYLTKEKRDLLLAKEPNASEILVPILRGRFIKKYGNDWDKTWMIGTFPSRNLDIEVYPEVKKHLAQYLPKLNQTGETFLNKHGKKEKTRKRTINKWFETQDSISYWREFNKPKIIYPNMTKQLPFFLDKNGSYYVNDKAFILTSDLESLPWLTAFFNSAIFRCCFKDNFPNLGEDRRELRKVFLEKIPVKNPMDTQSGVFNDLVEYIQFLKIPSPHQLKDQKSKAITSKLIDDLIDACVMEVYFEDHMREKDLLFIDDVEKTIQAFDEDESDSGKWNKVESFYNEVSASKHPIRNRLMRIPIDSPDLLGVILKEGKV